MSQSTKTNTAERKRSAQRDPVREMSHVVQEPEAVTNMKKNPGEYGDHRLYRFIRETMDALHANLRCKVSAYIYGRNYTDGLNLAFIQVKRRRFYILASFNKSTSGEERLKVYDKMRARADKVIPRLREEEKCRVPEGHRILALNPGIEGALYRVKVDQAVAAIEERLKYLAKQPNKPKERKRHGRRDT